MTIVLNGTTGITAPDISVTAQSTDITTTGDITAVDATLSGGVYLGGTGAANYLDDYEEGTWTPSGPQGFPGGGISSASGTYTKIGNTVCVQGYMNAKNDGTTMQIGNLPFTSSSDAGAKISHQNLTATFERISSSATTIAFTVNTTNTGTFREFYIFAVYRTSA